MRKPEFTEFFELMLAGTLHLHIICTSRVSIGAGRTYTVKSLDCDSSLGEKSESVSLLLSFARHAKQRAFGLGTEQLAMVARRVSGIPLALGLAAGCLASQSFADFESGFGNAGRSPFVLAERFTTELPLRQILMHSFALLSQHERNVMRCVSVLEGEFSLDEAVIVGSPVNTSSQDVEHLAGIGFIEQSEPGHKLFRVHDAILEFLTKSARSIDEMLIQSQAQSAHFGLFASHAQEFGVLMAEGKWDIGVGAIFKCTPNFRRATKYASNHDEPEQIAKLADGLARTYLEAGFLSDFESLSKIASISARKSGDLGLLSRMLGLQGALASRRSQAQECEHLWQERLSIGKASGDVFTASDALTDLAWHAYEQAELDKALTYLDEAEVLAHEANVPELVATAQVIKSRIEQAMGQLELATLNLHRCEETIKECSNRDLLMFVYQALTSAYEEVANPAMAQNTCLKLLSEAAAGHRAILVGWALRRLAPLFEQTGQLVLAGQGLVAAEKVHGEYDTKHRDLAALALSDFESRFGEGLKTELALAKLATWPTLVQTILDKASRQ
jgi:tetratricopeptide (TPR) repeat protein